MKENNEEKHTRLPPLPVVRISDVSRANKGIAKANQGKMNNKVSQKTSN